MPNLDFLRSVAVLCVYFFHLGIYLGYEWHVDIGHFGVILFFVHTALVLMMSLGRDQNVSRFYLRRLFRIYPLSLVVVSTIVLFHLPRAPWWPWQEMSGLDIASNLLLTTNLTYSPPVSSVLWSLPLEVQMYVMLPLIFLAGKRLGPKVVVCLWALSVMLALVLPRGRLEVFAYGPCFMAGVLAYFITWRASWRIWPAVLLAACAVFHFVGAWAACLLVGVFVPLCAQVPWARVWALIAKYSYGVYLTHLLALSVPGWPLKIALSVGLPVILYHLIEAPMIRLGQTSITWPLNSTLPSSKA